MNTRIRDPQGVLSFEQLQRYDEKLKINFKRLSYPAKYGGNPLAFALAADKFHIIDEKLDPPTAATDGFNFFWHPNRLEELSTDQLYFTLEHEIMHIALGHCLKERVRGKIPFIWNLAVDYKVNSIQERSFRNRRGLHGSYTAFEHPLWNGALGIPVGLAEMKEMMIGKTDETKIGKRCRPVDMGVLSKTAENIYDELYEHLKSNGRVLSFSMDASDLDLKIDLDADPHIQLSLSQSKFIEQLMKATERVKMLRGTVPGEVESYLGQLVSPEICWSEYCDAILRQKKKENGLYRNWTKFKRRYIHQRIYIPTTVSYEAKFIVLLDTSASMSDRDIAFGVSQLLPLTEFATGIVVPMDTVPHWDAATEIKKATDLTSIKVVGRGGTVFDDFFKHYRTKLGDFDLIVVITDGLFGHLDISLKPPATTAWVTVNYSPSITVPFGKIMPLYNKEN